MTMKRIISKELAKLSDETVAALPDGTEVTRGELLARLLWDRALGYVEKIRDAEGNQKAVQHAPEAWALQTILERLEGKAATVLETPETSITATDKVRDVLKERLNQKLVKTDA